MSQIEFDKPLDALTTFRLAARAQAYVAVDSLEALRAAFAYALENGLAVKLLGGGANIVAMPQVSGLVVHPAMKGIRFETDDAGVLVTAGAGEALDAVVRASLARGAGGLENLSAIPGHIGGAVVQNVGAYGLELAERFVSARVYDAKDDMVREFDLEACDFSYRMSVFKRPENEGRFVVLDATLRLPKDWQPVLGYKALAERFADPEALAGVTPAAVAEAVREIRAAKLPDPAQIGSAGSFFKNPVVTVVKARELLTQNGSLVSYPIGGDRVKLAAGWLIDACGLKGAAVGDAAVYSKHALIIVNRGHATGEDVAALSRRIIARVESRFGVTLEPEPVFLGA